MNKEAIQEITKYLDKVSEKLGAGADQVWPWFIKQVYIDAIFSITYFVVAVICIIIAVKKGLLKNYWVKGPIGITTCIISVIVLFIITVYFLDAFPALFNPEYYALKKIIRFVK